MAPSCSSGSVMPQGQAPPATPAAPAAHAAPAAPAGAGLLDLPPDVLQTLVAASPAARRACKALRAAFDAQVRHLRLPRAADDSPQVPDLVRFLRRLRHLQELHLLQYGGSGGGGGGGTLSAGAGAGPGMADAWRGLPALRSLRLIAADGVGLSDGLLATLPALGSQLSQLGLIGAELEARSALAGLQALAGLAALTLRTPALLGANLAPLAGLRALQSVHFAGCTQLTSAGLAHLPPGLTELRISGSMQLVSPGALGALAALRVLRVFKCPELHCDALPVLPGLTRLDVTACPLADRVPPSLAACTALVELCLDRCKLAGLAALAPLQGLTRLTRLDLAYCPRLPSGALGALRGLTGLRQLNLPGCTDLDGDALRALRPLTRLDSLDLYHWTRLGEADLGALGALGGLARLDLSALAQLRGGLAALRGLPLLAELRLVRCVNLLGNELRAFYDMPALRSVDLTGCVNVDALAVSFLRRRRPDLQCVFGGSASVHAL